jgi:hypothetical protein
LRSVLIVLLAHASKVAAMDWVKCRNLLNETLSANPGYMKNNPYFLSTSTQTNPLLTLVGCEVRNWQCGASEVLADLFACHNRHSVKLALLGMTTGVDI